MALKEFWFKNKKFNLNITNKNSINYKVNIYNKEIIVDLVSIDKEKKNIFFLKIDKQIYKSKILEQTNKKIILYIFNFNKTFEIELKDSENIIPAKRLDQNNDVFIKELKSPITGKVIKTYVKPGEFIRKNQTLITIESMKMENEIKASHDSFVKNVFISASDLVEQNQMLMTFEKKGEKSAKSEKKNKQKTI